MIFTWVASSLIAGEVILFFAMLWFRDRADPYPPGWFYFLLTLFMFIGANTSLFAYMDTYHRTETLRLVIARRIEVDSLMRALDEMESSQRGYLLTGKAAYLDPYNKAVRDIAARQEAVRSIYSGLPDEPDAATFRRMTSLKLAEMADVIDAQRAGTPRKAIEIVQTDNGKNLMDVCREACDRLLAINFAEYDRERHGVANAAQVRIGMAALLIVGSVLQMVFGAYRFQPRPPDAPPAARLFDPDLPDPGV